MTVPDGRAAGSGLDWPAGWDRTPADEREDTGKFDAGLRDTLEDLETELADRIGVDDWRLSTAAEHQQRNPNYPYADASPADPGAVVRWSMDGDQYAVACDRYTALRDNLRTLLLYLREKRKMAARPVTTGHSEFATARLPAGADGVGGATVGGGADDDRGDGRIGGSTGAADAAVDGGRAGGAVGGTRTGSGGAAAGGASGTTGAAAAAGSSSVGSSGSRSGGSAGPGDDGTPGPRSDGTGGPGSNGSAGTRNDGPTGPRGGATSAGSRGVAGTRGADGEMTPREAAAVLGLASPEVSAEAVKVSFEEAVKVEHPDQGGPGDIDRLKRARDVLLD